MTRITKTFIYKIKMIKELIILDDFKILAKGAIGYMTFGAYHMYITTNMINENNRNTQLRFDELFKKIEKLERINQ